MHWFRKHQDRVVVAIGGSHGRPRQLVEEAIAQQEHDRREERRGRGSTRAEYWCVFDRDDHPEFDRAITDAESNGIRVAVSNPCIELWFMLHFEDQTAWISSQDAQRRSKDLLKCDKVLTEVALERLEGRFADAKRRAKLLDRMHHGDGRPPRANPSSNLWELIESITGQTNP